MGTPYPLPPLRLVRPRVWMNARFRDGALVEVRPLSEREGTSLEHDKWIGLGFSAPGSTLESARRRCWRRWWRLSAGAQHDIITAAVLEARARGVLG